jgi:hypothetical protein
LAVAVVHKQDNSHRHESTLQDVFGKDVASDLASGSS